jgi:Uncharacterised nucleotidyltransferase
MPAGKAMAAALTGTWRRSPPPLAMPAKEVAAVTPLLIASGAGALWWWRLRHSPGQLLTTREDLRQTYQHYAVHAAKHEREVAEVFRILRSAGLEPILLKGWAIGRLYPEAGLRPPGDIDLYVAPEKYQTARAVLNRPENREYWVDLDHDEIKKFKGRSFEDLYSRSELVTLHDTEVRTLGPEDHLRTLCLHLLKHGAWRPLWLCDIAAALESRPAHFDWDRCLGKNKRQEEWVLCTIGLAHRLLGAELGDAPVSSDLPPWLPAGVLKQWNAPYAPVLPEFASDLTTHWRAPGALLKNLGKRWPNPIQATVDAGGDFNEAPRLPFQIRHCLERGMKLLRPQADLQRK